MYMNSENNGMMIGRVARMAAFDNADGSRNILLTIAVRRDTKGEKTDFLQAKGFVPAGKKGPYDYISIGDKIQLTYSLRAESYEDRDGQTVYSQVCRITQVNFLETREVRNQHRAAHQEQPEERPKKARRTA